MAPKTKNKKAKISKESSDSDEPPALIPVNAQKAPKDLGGVKHTASVKDSRRRIHQESKDESSDDDHPPSLVPLKMFNTTPHTASLKPVKALAEKVKAVPPPFQKVSDHVDISQVPTSVLIDAPSHAHPELQSPSQSQSQTPSHSQSRSQIQAANVAHKEDDEMSMCTESSEDEDEDEESSYATEDDDDDFYEDDGTEDDEDDEDDEEDEDNELDNVCQCPTCQRERERSDILQARQLREIEGIAASKLASRLEKIRKANTPTGPGTRTIPYDAPAVVDVKKEARLNSEHPDLEYIAFMEKRKHGHGPKGSGRPELFVQNIVGMAGYADRCQEELRFEDYAVDKPEVKKLKDHLENEMADRGKERVCRENMAISEAAIRRWMVPAATAWNQFLKGKDVYVQQKAGDSKETASEFFSLSLKTCATGDHARGCYFLRAKCNLSSRPQSAINDLVQCIKIDKYNAEAHYLLGSLIMDTISGSEAIAYERAEQYLLKAQTINPSLFADPNGEYAKKLLKAKGKATEARTIVLAELKKNAGNAALQRNSYVEAEELYTAALNLTSTSDKSHIYFSNRAAARFEIGMASDTKKEAVCNWLMSAVSDCDRSLALKADYAKAQFRRHVAFAEAQFLKNNFADALTAFAAALELDKENKSIIAGVKKTRNAIAAIEARELVANMEKLQLEREAQRAAEKENERKAAEEKRLEQEQLRREKAEKLKADNEARAKAKQEREMLAKETARQALEEKKVEKERQKAEKEASKADKVGDKEAEKAAKKAAKEKAKEEEKHAKVAREREAAAAVEAARIKREDFAKEMERVAAVVAGSAPAVPAAAMQASSDAAAAEAPNAKSAFELKGKGAPAPAAALQPSSAPVVPIVSPALASALATAPVLAPALAPAPVAALTPAPAPAPVRKVGVSALSAIASSVGAAQRKPSEAGDKAIPTERNRTHSSPLIEGIAEPEPGAVSKPAHVAKPAVSAAPAPAANAKTIRTVHMEIEPAKVGAVIGAKGVIINEIMKRSGAKIIVNQDFPGGAPQRVVIQGNMKQVTDARPLLVAVIAEGPHALTQPNVLKDYMPGGVHEILATLSTVSAMKEYEAAYALAIERQSLAAGSSQSSPIDPAAAAAAAIAANARARVASADAPQCIICCEPIDGFDRLYACGSCEHLGACSMCFLRLRSISKSKQCPVCRTSLDLVFATYAPEQSFTSLQANYHNGSTHQAHQDLHLDSKMVFPKEHLRSHVLPLYSYKCPVENCNTDCKEHKRLQSHLQGSHNLRHCELCVQNKQVFPSELTVYTSVDYIAHLKGGEGGKDGHPSCSYCQTYFYNKSDLFAHVNAEHKVCTLCNSDGNQKYYRDQTMLHQHYQTSHFTCEESSCVAKPRMTPYRSLFDLQAHKREFHGSSSTSVHSSMPLPNYASSNHMGIAYNPGPNRGGTDVLALQDDMEAFPALGSTAAYPPLGKENQKHAVETAATAVAAANINAEAAAAAALAAAAGSNTRAPAFYPRPQSRSNSFGNSNVSPLVASSQEGNTDYSGELRGLAIDDLLIRSGGFQGGVGDSIEQPSDNDDFEDNGSSMMYDAQAQALLSDADQSDQMYPGMSLHQSHHWGLNYGRSSMGLPMYGMGNGMGMGLPTDPLEAFQLPLPARNNNASGDSLMGGFDLAGMSGGDSGSDHGGSLSGSDFLGFLGPEDAVGGVPLRFNRSGGMGVDGLGNDAGGSFGFGDSSLAGNATSASYLLSSVHGNRLNHSAGNDLHMFEASSLSLPQLPLPSLTEGGELASVHDRGLGSLSDFNLSFNEDLDMALGAVDDDDDDDSYISDTQSGSGSPGGDCRIPVHDLPHDHFHELDEVSASNAAIIRATFAPEFIERLIGVLRAHPGGILGSAFPEAYRKMYGQRLILETKRGKKIKLLSVLEGHPNFYKSGMRVGGLKLHYQPNHEEVPGLIAGTTAVPSLPASSAGRTVVAPNRFGPHTSAAFASSTGYAPTAPISTTESGIEPGLEVDLLSADDFLLVAWMREHGMHMYRWAGNEFEWTEYALSLRPELLVHLTTAAGIPQHTNAGTLSGATSELSLVEQLKADSGCDVTVQTERLNGAMAHFMVMVRGSSSAQTSIQAFDRCQRMLTQTILAAMHCWIEANQLTHGSALGLLSGREVDDGYLYADVDKDERDAGGEEDDRVHSVLDIPQSTVALIQGNNGKRLHLLRKKSGAFVTLMTKVKGKGPAKLNISGSAQAVAIAINLVKDVIAAGV